MSLYVTLPTPSIFFSFFFNDTATTEIYTLSLHDALPISYVIITHALPAGTNMAMKKRKPAAGGSCLTHGTLKVPRQKACVDRKSTRLNSSHSQISYAVFCLKKKKKEQYKYDNRKNQRDTT